MLRLRNLKLRQRHYQNGKNRRIKKVTLKIYLERQQRKMTFKGKSACLLMHMVLWRMVYLFRIKIIKLNFRQLFNLNLMAIEDVHALIKLFGVEGISLYFKSHIFRRKLLD